MGAIKLTDNYLRTLEAPASGRAEVADAVCRGLYFRVTANGVRSWSFRYRDRVSGKTERLSIGRFPTIGLAKARDLADEQRVSVAQNRSPVKELRKARQAERSAITFGDLADGYFKAVAAAKKASTLETEKAYLKPFRAAFYDRKAKEITRREIADWLKKRATVAAVSANRTRNILNAIFNYALEPDVELLEASPMGGIKPPAREAAGTKDRILFDDEIPVLWSEFDGMMPVMKLALRVHLLLGQRPGEVAAMEIGELHDLHDTSGARWELPKEKVKNARLHVVPLPPMALALIREAIKLKPRDDETPNVFASPRAVGQAIDRHSFSRALQRVVDGLQAKPETATAVARLKAERPTPHDFRRTCLSGLARFGVAPEIRSAVANHSPVGVTQVFYDRYDRIAEKRAALQLWSDHVAGLVSPSDGAMVIKLERRA
jgi:integrase